MSTRSLTVFYLGEGYKGNTVAIRKPLVCLYGHLDGGVNFYGKELSNFLSKFTLVNGLPCHGRPTESRREELAKMEMHVANGMGCLAAQVIAHFKTEAGNFYVSPIPKNGDDNNEDYVYQVYEKDGKICLTVENEGYKKFLLNDSVGNNGHVSKVVTFMYENNDGTRNRRMLEILRESEDRLSGNDLDRDGYRCFLKKKIIGKIVTVQ